MPLREASTPRRRGAASRLALRAGLLALVPALAHAQDLGCDLSEVEVRSLEFRGNRALSDDELALRVTTTPSDRARRALRVLGTRRCLHREYLPRDLATLEAYYRERGFYSMTADTIIRTMSREAVRVTFVITEGRPTILRSYVVNGLGGLEDSAAIANSLRLRAGRPFDRGQFVADLDSITRRLRNSGYYRASTLPSYRRDSASAVAEAEVTVLPGVRARFATPVIHSTPVEGRRQQVSDNVVRRVIRIAAGSLYSDRAITEAQRSLFQLGVYRHVEVAPLPDSLQPPGDSIVVLDVRLTEDYSKRLDSEYGWATLDCGRIRAQYADLNFARSARRFELTGQASKIGYGSPLASGITRDVCTLGGSSSDLARDSAFSSRLHYYGGVSIRQPRLLGTQWVPTLSLYSERRGEYKAYLRSTTVGADASAVRDIADRTQLRLGYSQEYGRTEAPDAVLCALFSRCDDDSRREISREATLGVASVTLARLRADNLMSPTRGSVMRVEVRSSASPLLGTSRSLFFNKGSGDMAFYAPLGRASVVSFRMRAGAVVGRRLSDTLPFIPPQERLYAGGATSVRGFQQNELGDVVYIAQERDVKRDTLVLPMRYSVADTVGYERVVPLGGNTLFVGNVELRVGDPFLAPNLLQYSFFLDGGDVWNRPSTPSLKWTPGFGIRLLTPIGPIQLNLGYNRYPRPAGPIYFEDPTRVTSATRPDISPLYCVSPGNTIDLVRIDGVIQPPPGSGCPPAYAPRQRTGVRQRLAFTFQIGPDF